MQKKVEGYFTVEAAMVLPMVLAVVLMVIYVWFFQYNRCLMEQDTGSLALRGVSMQAGSNEERIELLRQEGDAMYRDKYIAWEWQELQLKSGQGKIEVVQCGSLRLPFANGEDEKQFLNSTAMFENHIVSPVSFIRKCKRVLGG